MFALSMRMCMRCEPTAAGLEMQTTSVDITDLYVCRRRLKPFVNYFGNVPYRKNKILF